MRGWQSLKNKFQTGILPILSSYVPEATAVKFQKSSESYAEFKNRITKSGSEIIKTIATLNCDSFDVKHFADWTTAYDVRHNSVA